MTYQPDPNAQIGKIYRCVTNELEAVKTIIDRVLTTYPEVSKGGINNHLRYLVDKNLVKRKEIDGSFHYALTDKQTALADKQPELSQPLQILEYCKAHIGEEITANQLQKILNNNTTMPTSVLKKLQDQGGLKIVSNTRPIVYFILPEIAAIEKISWAKPKQELIPAPKSNGKDISQMNIGEIVSDYANVKSENERLKNALKRIAMELMDIIELEQ